jgi:hypothetical protein
MKLRFVGKCDKEWGGVGLGRRRSRRKRNVEVLEDDE